MKIKFQILLIIVLVAVIVIFYSKKHNSLKGIFEKNFEDGIIKITDKGKNKDINVSFSGWFNPYNEKGKTNLKKLTNHRFGVYCIRNKKTQEILYIGHSSSNLYKTLYRHFQTYNDTHKQFRAYYPNRNNIEVSVILSRKTHAPKIEMSLIKEYKPVDAVLKYEDSEIEFKESPDVEKFEEWEVIEETEAPF